MIRVLIINDDSADYRQPLLHRFYDYLCNTFFDEFEFHRLNSYKYLSKIALSRLEEYDVIWQGFRGAPLRKMAKELNESHITVIMESGDPILFGSQLFSENVKGVDIAGIIARTLYGNKELYEYKRNNRRLRYADVYYLPHCIEHIDRAGLKPIAKRTYDFCFMQKLDPYPTHEYKNKLYTLLTNAISNELEGKIAYIGETYSDTYRKILNDTKICVCSGCFYDSFVKMKYFEASEAGAVVLGENTDKLRGIYVPGKTLIESPYRDVEAVVEILGVALRDKHKLQQMSDMAIESVNEKGSFEITAKQFCRQLSHGLFYHLNDANNFSLMG